MEEKAAFTGVAQEVETGKAAGSLIRQLVLHVHPSQPAQPLAWATERAFAFALNLIYLEHPQN